MRYGVQFSPLSGQIHAGTVRKQADRELFITHCDVSGQALWAAGLWLLAHWDGTPYQITNATGQTFELTAKVITT